MSSLVASRLGVRLQSKYGVIEPVECSIRVLSTYMSAESDLIQLNSF